MTKKRLKQYTKLRREIDMLTERLSGSGVTVADTVKGSLAEYPYTLHTIPVGGVDIQLAERLRHRKTKLLAERLAIERFIDGITDSQMRMAIICKYIDGHSWARVARRIGGHNTPDSIRKAVERFLQKK